MKRITLHGKTFKPFIPEEKISEAIQRIADRLNEDFAETDQPPVFLCVLNGAIVFTGEILKRTTFDAELVSIKLSSYQGTRSTGTVLNVLGLTAPVTGKDVIICEDIVDTGNTIVALKELLLSQGARSVKICTLLLKPEVYKKDCKLDYVGMEIPNAFIVGYGLDYDELGRNYKDIYVIDR